MRLFISYARVDQRYCSQIVETLDVHDVWYDQRLYMGDDWWSEIVKRIKWCEAFLYLISPESVASEYCRRELTIAQDEGKYIFPILIQPRTQIPRQISHIHYVDMSKGLTVETVKSLLGAMVVAEREKYRSATTSTPAPAWLGAGGGGGTPLNMPKPQISQPPMRAETFFQDVAYAMEHKDFDKAIYLLKQAKTLHLKPRFIDIDSLLQEAEEGLEKQTYQRDAEREYQAILSLVKHSTTRDFGYHAFRSFREQFPDYDPENIASYYGTEDVPTLKWCDVDQGEVTIKVSKRKIVFFVNRYRISKYPITNAQFKLFLEATDGYCDPRWWNISRHSQVWHKNNPNPADPSVEWGDHPRTNVNWYEAVAFCEWMSFKTGLTIALPKEEQWQRSAQGDDGRTYAWGKTFDANNCNTKESGIGKTSHVRRFMTGASPYGVIDMVGNVWEWCDQNNYSGKPDADHPDGKRVVRGGSYANSSKSASVTSSRRLEPEKRNASLGFRVMIRD